MTIPPLLAQTFAEHIMAYGFRVGALSLSKGASQRTGELIAFSLTEDRVDLLYHQISIK